MSVFYFSIIYSSILLSTYFVEVIYIVEKWELYSVYGNGHTSKSIYHAPYL